MELVQLFLGFVTFNTNSPRLCGGGDGGGGGGEGSSCCCSNGCQEELPFSSGFSLAFFCGET